ncbi:hypothetical protein VTI74DRAFT_2277 [Chaetomium olivicolor]
MHGGSAACTVPKCNWEGGTSSLLSFLFPVPPQPGSRLFFPSRPASKQHFFLIHRRLKSNSPLTLVHNYPPPPKFLARHQPPSTQPNPSAEKSAATCGVPNWGLFLARETTMEGKQGGWLDGSRLLTEHAPYQTRNRNFHFVKRQPLWYHALSATRTGQPASPAC